MDQYSRAGITNETLDRLNLEDNLQYEYLAGLLSVFKDDKINHILHISREQYIRGGISNMAIIKNIRVHIMNHVRDMKIICLCASHISNMNRLSKLKNMLDSWNHQIFPIKMVISISYGAELNQEINSILDNYSPLIVLKNEKKKSQFEHYKNICKNYPEYRNYYILFTDDDDIWGENRSLAYATLIRIAELSKRLVDYIIYPYILEGDHYLSNNLEVMENYNKNRIKMINGHNEYVAFCVKMETFLTFINNCDEKLLNHKFCDRYFVKFLSNPNLDYVSMFIPFFDFCYYYHNNKYFSGHTISFDDIINDTFPIDCIFLYYLNCNKNYTEYLAGIFGQYKISDISIKNYICRIFYEKINAYKFLKDSPIFKN